MSKPNNNDQYMKDWQEWQDKQYLPGYYVGSKMSLPLKQLGKKKWFRFVSIVWLIIFLSLVAYFFVQMVLYIVNTK